ncbi:DUF3363 domain-containing protein [Phenylobacterium sp.]|uniref:DUF3363 domain-containing protein n=1 Tax=Phenylobacterium sp. TaxID=1871053 RepID=UPI0025D5F71E|nr:DUF3363 domain-containing protein [Phenylobacterium sp.]
MKRDRQGVRTALYQRLAASRLFALGDRSGVLKAAQGRSGRAFRLDVRQRVIVKALVCRHKGKGAVRGAALARHVAYLGRSGAGVEGARPEFFDRDAEGLNAVERTGGWGADRHHFRFIISPEHGDRIDDLKGYVGEVMARVSADLGEPGLAWIGTCHFDTDQPHAHVLVRGKRDDGRDLVIPRDYIGYGFRARAQEVAQERLGDLSRAEAERRIWKETGVDRFTGFDRRLLAAADQDGLVDDGVGRSDAWAALTRGRLRHLEKLGLASPFGHRYRLAADLEVKLRTLQIRQDVIRTLNQRRLEGARNVQQLGDQKVRGRVVRSGSHDELGGAAYVIVRDRAGTEHYARLAFGRSSPKLGAQVELMPGPKGAQILGLGRSTAERGL